MTVEKQYHYSRYLLKTQEETGRINSSFLLEGCTLTLVI